MYLQQRADHHREGNQLLQELIHKVDLKLNQFLSLNKLTYQEEIQKFKSTVLNLAATSTQSSQWLTLKSLGILKYTK